MSKFRNYQTNFSGGLLSKGMLGRVDLAQYENGCKQLENWWPHVTGGMRRRPGSRILNSDLSHADKIVRIEPFIFNEDQTYLVAFTADPASSGDGLRVYTPDGTQVAFAGGIGWSEQTILECSVTQKGDVMFIAHESRATIKLIRTGASSFTVGTFDFEGQPPSNAYPKYMPFVKFEDPEVTISVNGYAKNSTVTVTASAAVFNSRHVSRAIRYRGKQIYVTQLVNPAGGDQVSVIGTVLEELDRGAVLGFNSANDSPEDFEVGEIIVGRDSGIKAEVIATGSSSITVAMIAGIFPSLATEQVEGLTTGNIAQITSNSNVNPPASADWDEEAFSPTLGYPSVIEFHSQRLWIGGSSSLPAHIFGSRVAAFFNFDTGDAFPADSIQVAISGNQINKVTNIVSGRHLQVFTDAGEFYAPQSEDRPLVPETFDLLRQTRYGTQSRTAKVFDESTILVQAFGSAIREFIWQDNQRGYSADAISLIVDDDDDTFLQSIVETEVLYGGYDRPEQIAFFVCGDGTIGWYHAARAESIRTWGKWTTQGSYKSLAVLQDKLYALVERDRGDGTLVNYIEEFDMNLTLDAVEEISEFTPVSLWGGWNHWVDGAVLQVVTGADPFTQGSGSFDPDYYIGEFTLGATTPAALDTAPFEITHLVGGLGFTQTLETMPIEVKDNQGLTTGVPKRIVYAELNMRSTLAAKVEGNKVLTFRGEEDITERPAKITGVRRFYLLGYQDQPTITVTNEIPVPFEALSIGGEVEY